MKYGRFAAICTITGCLAPGCGGDDRRPLEKPGGGPDTGGTAPITVPNSGKTGVKAIGMGGVPGSSKNYPEVTFKYEPEGDGKSACGSTRGAPKSVLRPMDIVFIIDNSGSMDAEIQEVEQNVYRNFANIIESSGIDYRVILLSRYGSSTGPAVGESDFQVCIPPPLGATACEDPSSERLRNNTRGTPGHSISGEFFHYSADIESKDALCVLLATYDQPDEWDGGPNRSGWAPLAPRGWGAWLRQNAFKTFVVVTDDDVSCSDWGYNFQDRNGVDGGMKAAEDFDRALLALDPAQFGSAADRKYVWHSIIGMAENQQLPGPWHPIPGTIQTATCRPGSSGPGTGYQALSIATQGLRYPICPDSAGQTNFDPVFRAVARGVVELAAVPCEYEFPEVEGVINPQAIEVHYRPGDGGPAQNLTRVSDAGACSGQAYYFDDENSPSRIFLCPSACSAVQADGNAELILDFGCLGS